MAVVLKDVDFDLAILQMPEALHEQAPLQTESGQKHVDAHAAEAVSLQEGHQEPEADEDHDVNILKHWRNEEGRLADRALLCNRNSTTAKCGREIESHETLL